MIIGSQKCGTTALAKFLGYHPKVAISTREPHYFDKDNADHNYEIYLQQMTASTGGQVTMEKTPKYFKSPKAALGIEKYQTFLKKRLKFILIVRDPIKRAVSAMHHKQRHRTIPKWQNLTRSLLEAEEGASAINHSLYGSYLQLWLRLFQKDQFLILDGESFCNKQHMAATSLLSV